MSTSFYLSFCLQPFFVKHQDRNGCPIDFRFVAHLLPETVKVLQWRTTYVKHMMYLIRNRIGSGLVLLSLAMDVITDNLIYHFTHNLRLLVTLDLEDRPRSSPQSHNDFSNHGLQLLATCSCLTNLSVVRRREHVPATFRMVNDFGMFLLVEDYKNLESVKLGGFSRVTDAGFASILLFCTQLRKFEVINSFFLSDLAFYDLRNTSSSLVDVRLPSCSLLTSKAAQSIALWTDITDSSLRALGCGNAPIDRCLCDIITDLCIKNCFYITDASIEALASDYGAGKRKRPLRGSISAIAVD
ncbi:hypothetical protein H6P81_008846 [Aristolochia fimbriata]|uniref:F-box/LRR-repeat protein 15-like leucin rich repeat domain-containing protein n=1 Tax=Aristolochia fimbriata TaxID=158543 RepID=A0AAV7EKF5_ARIFI|nr:hypothetical protein H6P81_008846 [Aristolochia fimbriata]